MKYLMKFKEDDEKTQQFLRKNNLTALHSSDKSSIIISDDNPQFKKLKKKAVEVLEEMNS